MTADEVVDEVVEVIGVVVSVEDGMSCVVKVMVG